MGCGTKLRMGCPLPPSGSGLRKTRLNSWSFPLPRLRLPHDRKPLQVTRVKLITGSSDDCCNSLLTSSKKLAGSRPAQAPLIVENQWCLSQRPSFLNERQVASRPNRCFADSPKYQDCGCVTAQPEVE